MKKFILPAIILVVVLVTAAGGYYYYINSQKQEAITERQPSPTPEAMTEDKTATNGGDAEETQEVQVNATEFKLDPAKITVKAGEQAKLTLTNTGKTSHNWVVEGTSIKTKLLSAGESETIDFTIDKPGEYPFYCSVPGHRAQGMEGTLIVE